MTDREKALMDLILRNHAEGNDRNLSFDYCYRHFHTHYHLNDQPPQNMEKSCAILYSYLASWGMLRGSSFLLEKNYRYFLPLIEFVANPENKDLWNIDLSDYPENYGRLTSLYRQISELVVPAGRRSLTLVTKIMLGVFGIVPAYDSNFCAYMKTIDPERSGFSVFNQESLEVIYGFYQDNRVLIDHISNTITVQAFDGNSNPEIHYPKARVIDMIGFYRGSEMIGQR